MGFFFLIFLNLSLTATGTLLLSGLSLIVARRGYSVAVHGLLMAVASLIAEHRL